MLGHSGSTHPPPRLQPPEREGFTGGAKIHFNPFLSPNHKQDSRSWPFHWVTHHWINKTAFHSTLSALTVTTELLIWLSPKVPKVKHEPSSSCSWATFIHTHVNHTWWASWHSSSDANGETTVPHRADKGLAVGLLPCWNVTTCPSPASIPPLSVSQREN